jgi:hypothetical protein
VKAASVIASASESTSAAVEQLMANVDLKSKCVVKSNVGFCLQSKSKCVVFLLDRTWESIVAPAANATRKIFVENPGDQDFVGVFSLCEDWLVPIINVQRAS